MRFHGADNVPIVDYSDSYPNCKPGSLGKANYAELKSGSITVDGKEVSTASLSSYPKAKEIAGILKAWIQEGLLALEIQGTEQACEQGQEHLASVGVSVQPLSQAIARNDERCIHCGACIPSCPSGALSVARPEMIIEFDNEKCIACELCIKACPTRAMGLHF